MYGVIRYYHGAGADELFNLLEARKADVEALIRGVPGFVAYALVRSDGGGGHSVTICSDKAGTDASMAVAATWVQANVHIDGLRPPVHSEGEVILQL